MTSIRELSMEYGMSEIQRTLTGNLTTPKQKPRGEPNLALSTIAAFQAPIIMMSQNRQATKDRITAAHAYEVNLKMELEIDGLHEKIDAMCGEQFPALVTMQQAFTHSLSELKTGMHTPGNAGNAPA